MRSASLERVTRHDADRRQKILECIARAVDERGYPPSVREIADAVGLASTSAVHHHLIALEREGLLERGTHSSRALRLTQRHEPAKRQAAGIVTPFRMPVEREVLPLPVLGEIAAGQPIEAYADATETLDVPASLHAAGDAYVLRVRGKSMIVALLEDNGVTLKRFFREDGRIRLQPANAEMAPIYATEVQIQGKVIGVIRRLG